MSKRYGRAIAGCFASLLLLVAGATNAAAQSGKATLLVTANVVTSTAIVFNADGTANIITANGPTGLTMSTVKLTAIPGQVATLGSGPGSTFTAEPVTQRPNRQSQKAEIVVPTLH